MCVSHNPLTCHLHLPPPLVQFVSLHINLRSEEQRWIGVAQVWYLSKKKKCMEHVAAGSNWIRSVFLNLPITPFLPKGKENTYRDCTFQDSADVKCPLSLPNSQMPLDLADMCPVALGAILPHLPGGLHSRMFWLCTLFKGNKGTCSFIIKQFQRRRSQ